LARGGHWPAMVGLGALPWAVALSHATWPERRRQQLGRLATLTVATGWVGVFAPVALVAPFLAALLWSVLGEGPRRRVVVLAGVATLLGSVLMLPWIMGVPLVHVLGEGRPIEWSPPWWAAAAFLAAAVATVAAGDRRRAVLAGWGTILGLAGYLITRTGPLGGGREPGIAGLLLAALGTAIVFGSAFGGVSRPAEGRRWAGWMGPVASGVLVATVLLVVPGGRAHLPPDRLTGVLEFTDSLAPEHGADRALIIGPPEALPGEGREGDGYHYRAVSAPMPALDESWPAALRVGDRALAATLQEIEAGQSLRPGRALAPFGIRWLVVVGDTPLSRALTTQVDLTPLPLSPEFKAFENTAALPRAAAEGGAAWRWIPPAEYQGPPAPGEVVRLAENADARWGSGWRQDDWANLVAADTGRASFGAQPLYAAGARAAGGMVLLLVAAMVVGRGGR
ncbi:MAG: hypothetical protein ACRDVM_10740, partial [Acidimicrobiia bacterium]